MSGLLLGTVGFGGLPHPFLNRGQGLASGANFTFLSGGHATGKPMRERLLAVDPREIQIGRACRHVPLARFDDVRRTHGSHVAACDRDTQSSNILLHDVELLFGFPVAPLLQVGVVQPPERVVAAVFDRQPFALDAGVGGGPGVYIGRGGFPPHPQRHENVGRHVQRVRGCWRNLGVDPRRAQAERRVNRIIVGVNQVMDRAGVPGILSEDLFSDAGRTHIGSKISLPVGRAEDRNRIETGGLGIIGKLARELSHGVRVGLGSRGFVALAEEESFDRSDIPLFPCSGGLSEPALGAGPQFLKSGLACVLIVQSPQQFVVR